MSLIPSVFCRGSNIIYGSILPRPVESSPRLAFELLRRRSVQRNVVVRRRSDRLEGWRKRRIIENRNTFLNKVEVEDGNVLQIRGDRSREKEEKNDR
ncbi:hypothetical protein BUALT_Bualt02G0190400 [Buddleja alternifolia]|uniref:Uncharacterized protein n=1 Tax=Buddleja alternifolia TaxID=168488 RepID=A0AAV6Y2N1_9LAMI|nr:hypothetical protein BUALT_Bualt02G0190400 [Buddleja alternifolia]